MEKRNSFKLQILKIDEAVFDGQVVSVTVPGSAGELTILRDHETFLSSLKAGTVTVTDADGKKEEIAIEQGFVEATQDKVTILL